MEEHFFFFSQMREKPPSWLLLFSFLGLLSLLRATSSLFNWLYVTFLRPGKDLRRYGSWALVTGATDGIGKAFAFQFARRGLHLVLVGRNLDKLRRVSRDIKAEHSGVDVKLVVLDLAAADISGGIRRLREAIEGLDVGVLVNNAGTTYPHAMYFEEVEEEVWEAVVKVNVEGTTRVSREVLPAMVERGRGAVVNVGSGSSVVVPAFPLYDVYAASKSYVDQFSRSLYTEYKSLGIDVQCQIPLYVATKMISSIKVKESSIFIPSPDAYAEAATRWIGYEARCIPYWTHSIQACLASLLLPHFLLNAWRLRIGIAHRHRAKTSLADFTSQTANVLHYQNRLRRVLPPTPSMELCSHAQHLQAQPLWLLLLLALGSISILNFSFSLLHWLYVSFLRPGKNLRRRYGAWAVVTGSTDGIGKAFAFQLARRGLNLVLVGRNPDKLKHVSEAIRAKYPKAQVETATIDFSGDLAEGVKGLEKAIKGLDVGVLVNNAGVSYPYARYFHEVDEGLIGDLIKVNIEGVTRVTQAVLPGMLERKKGAIVNIGSGAAIVIPSDPLYAVYAATKAYIDQFSRCLYVEYKNKGIDVQCQVPLYVATKMASIKRDSFFVPSGDTYARAAIRWIGYEPRCTPYWPHSFLWCLLSLVPECVIDKWRLSFCINIRKRGQLRDARKKEQ